MYNIPNYISSPDISNNQVIYDFTAAKNKYIEQKNIINIANYSTTEIDGFLRRSVSLVKEIEVDNNYLKDGYFGNVVTGVLKNRDNKSTQKIAIKTLKKTNEIPKDYQVLPVDISFFYEVKSLLKLQNQENIVQIIAACKNTTNYMYRIVLELGDISLDNYNNKFIGKTTNGFLTNDNLAYILKEVLSAVRTCIQFKIHHLDIHSGNLLIFFKQQKIKLSDFGMVALEYDELQSASNMKGQILFCLCECIVANSKNNPILSELLQSIKTKVIEQLQKKQLPLSEENILYQLHIEYRNKILEYAKNNKFLEYFLCFNYYYQIMKMTDFANIINLVENKFNCKFLTKFI